MIKKSAWLHLALSAYLWLITWIPLGNWNYQKSPTILQALIDGKGIDYSDIGLLAFVTMPAALFWIAYKKRSFWFGISTLTFDLFWLAMQIQSWWIPYIMGTNEKWQLEYAKGPTTKVLPSFGNHVAPDGMHFLISVFLVLALVTGIIAVIRLKLKR